ncbi:hypothetical protein [Phormidesmis priestleyi]|nr:hypothetical protein [Phormidesmis priestleyi]
MNYAKGSWGNSYSPLVLSLSQLSLNLSDRATTQFCSTSRSGY